MYSFSSDVVYKKKIKDWFARTQIYWQEFVNLSNAKNSARFVFQEFVFHALSTVIKNHYCSLM